MLRIPLILATLLTFGCAAKKMVTRNADVLLEYQIEKRLPLYSFQKAQLSKDVKAFLNNQKSFTKKNLPIISQIELDPQKVDEQYDRLQELYKHLSLEFSKMMGKYMAMLDSKQQKEFSKNLQGENKQLRRLTSKDQITKVLSRLELLFGSITDKQAELVKEKQSYFEARHKLRILRREELQKEFLEIYKMELPKAAKEKMFYEAFLKYQDSYPDNTTNKELITKLLTTLNDKQKSTFKKKTNEVQEMLKYYLDNQY